MDGDPTRFDASEWRGGAGTYAGRFPDQVVGDRSRTLAASRSRQTDDHEGRRAQDLGIDEARLGQVEDVHCTSYPTKGPGRCVKDRQRISR